MGQIGGKLKDRTFLINNNWLDLYKRQGYMTWMPQCGSLKLKPSERGVRLDRTQEVLTPYYYKVTTSEGVEQQIATELTATSRASFFRFRYPKQEKALLYLEAGRGKRGGGIEIFPEKREIRIYNEDRHDCLLYTSSKIVLLCYYSKLHNKSPIPCKWRLRSWTRL